VSKIYEAFVCSELCGERNRTERINRSGAFIATFAFSVAGLFPLTTLLAVSSWFLGFMMLLTVSSGLGVASLWNYGYNSTDPDNMVAFLEESKDDSDDVASEAIAAHCVSERIGLYKGNTIKERFVRGAYAVAVAALVYVIGVLIYVSIYSNIGR
jgi:hypothetical protein